MHTPLPSRTRRQGGFTLIELVIVIIVLGILTAVVSMGGSPLTSSRRMHAQALKADIRYAQSQAMKTGQSWGIAWTGNTYWLFTYDTALASSVQKPLPGKDALTVSLSALNVSLTSSIGSQVLSFDVAGRPNDNFTANSLLTSDQTMTMTPTDDTSKAVTFTITAETGYLQ